MPFPVLRHALFKTSIHYYSVQKIKMPLYIRKPPAKYGYN